MASLDERLRNSKYVNWLKVMYALTRVKDGLGSVTATIMPEFQEEMKTQCNTVQDWPENCLEIAKAYMPHGYAVSTGPPDTVCAGLLQLICNCKQFKAKIQLNPDDTDKVISVCNQTVRCPDLSLDDEYTVDSLNKFAEFLQSVLSGMTVKCDITSCQDAVADIKKLLDPSFVVTLTMELTCLGDQMAAVMKELTNACDNDSSTEVEVAHMQAKVLVNIVKGDPYLTSHLNSELARLNDKMDSIIHSMEHMKDRTLRTEERVNNIEARLEQLEVRRVAPGPSYKNSLQNFIQRRGLEMPKYNPITQLNGGYLAEVHVCGHVFKSSQVKLKKVDAEQEAAKLAFEYLQQPENQCTNTAGAVCSTDAATAAAAVSATGSVSASTPAFTADTGQSKGTVSVQPSSVTSTQANPVITKNSSLISILQQLCAELGLDPPTVEVSESSSSAYRATVSVRCGYSSLKAHAKKVEAQEDAAGVALLSLGSVEHVAKNCRTRLNEHCQQHRRDKPEYVLSDSGPFNCTVLVTTVHSGNDLATEAEAIDDAARGILAKIGRTDHLLQMIDDPRFESFCVSCNPYALTARYRFSRPAAGQTSKKNAEKVAAERALSALYPELDPKPAFDHCKNKLQELYTHERPKYVPVSGDDDLFYSEVTVSFIQQTSSTDLSSLSASDELAKRVLKRLDLIP